MLSKLTPFALLGATASAEIPNVTINARTDREIYRLLENHNPRPKARSGSCVDGGANAVNALKAGPANWPEVIAEFESSGEKYNDPWTGKDVLFNTGYPSEARETELTNNYDNGVYVYERFS
jgi:hypothetical protein